MDRPDRKVSHASSLRALRHYNVVVTGQAFVALYALTARSTLICLYQAYNYYQYLYPSQVVKHSAPPENKSGVIVLGFQGYGGDPNTPGPGIEKTLRPVIATGIADVYESAHNAELRGKMAEDYSKKI